MGEALTIRVRRERGYVVVAVAGEVDIATVARLRDRLSVLVAVGRSLVVDLDQVSFIDAAGLGALAGASGRAAAHGAGLHVVCARPQTVRLFRMTGLDCQIPLARSLDEALEALAAARDTPALAVPGRRRPGRRPGPGGERTQAMRPGGGAPGPWPAGARLADSLASHAARMRSIPSNTARGRGQPGPDPGGGGGGHRLVSICRTSNAVLAVRCAS